MLRPNLGALTLNLRVYKKEGDMWIEGCLECEKMLGEGGKRREKRREITGKNNKI